MATFERYRWVHEEAWIQNAYCVTLISAIAQPEPTQGPEPTSPTVRHRRDWSCAHCTAARNVRRVMEAPVPGREHCSVGIAFLHRDGRLVWSKLRFQYPFFTGPQAIATQPV